MVSYSDSLCIFACSFLLFFWLSLYSKLEVWSSLFSLHLALDCLRLDSILLFFSYTVRFYAWFLLLKRGFFFTLPVLFYRFVASAFACVYAFQLALHLFGLFVGSFDRILVWCSFTLFFALSNTFLFALSFAVSLTLSRLLRQHRVQWSYAHFHKHSVVVHPYDDAIGRSNKTRSNRHTHRHNISNNNKPKKRRKKMENTHSQR